MTIRWSTPTEPSTGDCLACQPSPTLSWSPYNPPLMSDRPGGPTKVFVSYATADLATVDLIKKWSTDPKVEVFVAEHSARPGTALNELIIAEIQACDLFLLMWSADAARSEYVLQEV